MRPALLTTVIASLLIVMACQRDPGRDVKPMADPLRNVPDSTAGPTEIIPLEKVSKSQAAAVSQRIATTEITITYSRPIARGRELFGKLVPAPAQYSRVLRRTDAACRDRRVTTA